MTTVELNVSDLVARMKQPRVQAGRCQVTLSNAMPPEWGVTIGEAGVKFFYRDGTDYPTDPKDVNLGSGETATFLSDDASKCVFGIFMAARVHVPDEEPQLLTDNYQEEDGKCTLHVTFTLGPKASVSAEALGSSRTSDYLGFRIEQ